MNDYVSAAAIGLSFSNMWICALLVFALKTSKKASSIGYIIGRVLTVILLAVIISFIGKVVLINSSIPHFLSGLLILILASYILCSQVFNINFFQKKMEKNQFHDCGLDCKDCRVKNIKKYNEYCDSCRKDEAECLAYANGFKELITKNKTNMYGYSNFIFGMFLGSLKGTIFCGKFLLIAPIMLSSSLVHSLSIGIVFSITSSLYPIIGFFFGSFALKFIRYRKIIFLISSIILFLISIKYILNGIYS